MPKLSKNWRRGLVIAELVFANLALSGARTKLRAQEFGSGCALFAYCWCHASGACDAIGTGHFCGVGGGAC